LESKHALDVEAKEREEREQEEAKASQEQP
jgi:hypothetical protein